MIVRWHKDQNYFIVRMYQDLMGDWIITQSWGHCGEDEGEFSHTVAGSYDHARALLNRINQQQRARGFQLNERREEQLWLDFG
ncbi:hypothetical protein [Marinobacterium arenosum]|uniref:hypothetical protein n=1 Tax=Marinobacterium arenosum TaxID=2862496 RepID=UPI001C97FE7C|nr:hypothetical protein [Marinobacterium arenosum]MBY4678110.1 hypothetical protein [Marinobacterium arenosum]